VLALVPAFAFGILPLGDKPVRSVVSGGGPPQWAALNKSTVLG
jgi:hypothetical protein